MQRAPVQMHDLLFKLLDAKPEACNIYLEDASFQQTFLHYAVFRRDEELLDHIMNCDQVGVSRCLVLRVRVRVRAPGCPS